MSSTVGAVSSTNATTTSSSDTSRVPQQNIGPGRFSQIACHPNDVAGSAEPGEKDTDFIAQMAQFSSLEQSKQMTSDMSQLRAGSLLGQQVEVQGTGNSTITGTVSAVKIESGVPNALCKRASHSHWTNWFSVAQQPVQTTTTTATTTPNV